MTQESLAFVSEIDYSKAVTGFTKLFSTIIHSTVWREDMHVKIVWVTMLAMADRNGRVWASVPGLADAARVSLPQCREALERLGGPDPDSRTQTYQGRRIKHIDGGWELLNYLKYREMRDMDERRLQTRAAVQRHRAKKAESLTVSQGRPRKPEKAQAEEEAEADSREHTTDSVAVAPEKAWTHMACDQWTARFGGTVPGGRITKALKPLVDTHGWPEVQAAWGSYLSQTEAEFVSPQRFAATYGRWSGSSPDRKQSLAQTNRTAGDEWEQEVREGKR